LFVEKFFGKLDPEQLMESLITEKEEPVTETEPVKLETKDLQAETVAANQNLWSDDYKQLPTKQKVIEDTQPVNFYKINSGGANNESHESFEPH
jgi:hypothetical protein